MSVTKTKTRTPRSEGATASATAPSVVTSKYAVGDDVAHPQFGDGTITDIEGDKLTIKFADGRVKQIVDYYVKRRRPALPCCNRAKSGRVNHGR